MQLAEELSFLRHHLIDPIERHRNPSWLLTNFDDNVWPYSLGFKTPKILDWRINLSCGSNLISRENSDLLTGLKYFLTSSTNSVSGDGDTLRSNTGRANYFNRAIHVIDYLLLHDKALMLEEFALGAITKNDLTGLLYKISNQPDSAEAIYDWKQRLVEYGFTLLATTSEKNIQQVMLDHPELCELTPDQEDTFDLDFDISLVPKLRAAFFIAGHYGKSNSFGYSLKSTSISKIIYERTLRGRTEDKPVVPIFSFHPLASKYFREFPGIPVTNRERETATTSSYTMYRSTIYNLGILHEMHVPAPPIEDLIEIQRLTFSTEETGRFKTVPTKIVFSCIKDAIEFHLKHGRVILDSYCAAAKLCIDRGLKMGQLDEHDFLSAIGKKAIDLGITKPSATADKSKKADSFFTDLRANRSLLECVSTYYGAVQFVVGCLSARRVGELQDLIANRCLDKSETWIYFDNEKSTKNLMGMRRREARPIDPMAVKMLKEIIRFQEKLINIGALDDYVNIFSTPSLLGDISLSAPQSYIYNRNFDYFCDFFETPLNSKGQRYYIRQHQLRRFFAIVFFRSSSFGGIDTLRWMLGHVDLEHTWRYITENVGGAILRGAKAQAVAETLHEGAAHEFEALSDLIEQRFLTRNFTIIDADELSFYIESLLEKNKIHIEPTFIKDEHGEKVKIVVKVIGVPKNE